jgi:hypothetical protein
VTCTLAEIERETAYRVGPFVQAVLDRQLPSTANLETVYVPSLRSNIEQDLVTNLWLLRRGIDSAGNAVVLLPEDRQRMVAAYDAASGAVHVERPYTSVPAASEVVEFHHLNPELELRVAVRAGLKRCLFEDRFQLGQGYIYEADLTYSLPWLDDMNMVKRMQVGPFPTNLPGAYGPVDVPFEVFGQEGHVWVRVVGSGAPFFGGLLVLVHRPHFSWVNGADAVGGPTADADWLEVDLEYAAAAAHIEAWRRFPVRMQAAAAGGLQATQAMAALEYTRQSWVHRLPPHDLHQFRQTYGWRGRHPLVVNA